MSESLSAPGLPARRSSARGPSARVSWPGVPTAASDEDGAASGGVRHLLRLEGVAVLAVSLAAYAQFGAGWGVFALWLLAPDLALVGYLGGTRAGALLYNATHSYIGPIALLALGVLAAMPWAVAGGLIWSARIGLDRAFGHGLKYGSGFGFTHLGRVGRQDPW